MKGRLKKTTPIHNFFYVSLCMTRILLRPGVGRSFYPESFSLVFKKIGDEKSKVKKTFFFLELVAFSLPPPILRANLPFYIFMTTFCNHENGRVNKIFFP